MQVEVRVLPGRHRPGVGRAPARENRRAWLPQQARFCPVLEDASRSGFLVYPPLHEHESYQVRLTERNSFLLTFLVGAPGGGGLRAPAFAVEIQPSGGTGGLDHTEIVHIERRAGLTEDLVGEMLEALVTNVNAPPGGIGLRGAHDFVTPEGWDTLYTGVLNEAQQPALPVLAARVETDWYAQATEFRYVLQRGDVLSASGGAPVGQVLFLPRADVRLAEASPEDLERFATAQQEYWDERHRKERVTNFGATYSYHYRDVQKSRQPGGAPSEPAPERAGAAPGDVDDGPSAAPTAVLQDRGQSATHGWPAAGA